MNWIIKKYGPLLYNRYYVVNERIEGLDVARALAMFGMLIVNYTVITHTSTEGDHFLAIFMHLFEGRASALFVILAGVGLTLLTKQAYLTQEVTLLAKKRRDIQKRAAFLFGLGLLLYLIGWTGDILHYYGVYLFMASFVFQHSSKRLLVGAGSLIVFAQLAQIKWDYLAGWHPERPLLEYLDFWTAQGFLRHLLFNGYHPLLPWFSFLLIGLVLGRLLQRRQWRKPLCWWSIFVLISVETLARYLQHNSTSWLDADSAFFLFGTGPIPPNIAYLLSNTASSILLIIIVLWLCEKWGQTIILQALAYTGQLTLTHYVAHILVGVTILEVWGRTSQQSLRFVLLFAVVYFIISVLCSYVWRKQYKRGPIEWCMRKIIQ